MIADAADGRAPTLLVVTGASGTGKTTIIEPPRRRLGAGVAVLDKDLMWATDWPQALNNFLRLAAELAQSGIHTVLVGTIIPEHVDGLSDRHLVGEIAYLNLHCSDAERERRLLARPAWRKSSDPEFIERHRVFARWLLDNAAGAFGRPMPTVDTSGGAVAETVEAIAAWVERTVGGTGPVLHNVTFYVDPDEFDRQRSFYTDELGAPVVFEEAGHICCVDVGGDVAVCVHEEEPGHPAGTRELFFWVGDGERLGERRLTDAAGNQVRLHGRRAAPP